MLSTSPTARHGNRFVVEPLTHSCQNLLIFWAFFPFVFIFGEKREVVGMRREAMPSAGRPAGESTPSVAATRGPVERPTDADAPAGRQRRAHPPPPYRFAHPCLVGGGKASLSSPPHRRRCPPVPSGGHCVAPGPRVRRRSLFTADYEQTEIIIMIFVWRSNFLRSTGKLRTRGKSQ